MPPLITPRTRRRIGELVVAAGLAGALWGPVGSAEAGVSAGSAASAHFGTAKANTTGSLVGTGRSASKISILEGPVAERFGCSSPTWYTANYYLTLGSGWSTLVARSTPCTSSTQTGTWAMGNTFLASGWTTEGTFICRGGTYGYGSSTWYKTSRGWVWSGGTNQPVWDKTRNC